MTNGLPMLFRIADLLFRDDREIVVEDLVDVGAQLLVIGGNRVGDDVRRIGSPTRSQQRPAEVCLQTQGMILSASTDASAEPCLNMSHTDDHLDARVEIIED